MSFKWNEKTDRTFWDHQNECEILVGKSDAEIVKDPSGGEFHTILGAVCRVLAELVEIEESRGRNLAAEIDTEQLAYDASKKFYP